MALSCYCIALKCHPYLQLRTKPLMGSNRGFQTLPPLRAYGVGELSADG
jgi:hypothetical protein